MLCCVVICDSDIVSFIMWYDIWLWHVMICYVLRCMMITSRILLCIVTCALSVSLCVCVSILLHTYIVSVYCLSIHSPPVSLFFCSISVLLPYILSLPPSINITLNYFTHQFRTYWLWADSSHLHSARITCWLTCTTAYTAYYTVLHRGFWICQFYRTPTRYGDP